mmetsp:Transcript_5399/g.22857  ORF Transcript_5399/g.22857 Transcript_5399/m.22857 type:complete len:258 (-) Transcript_5399:2818-3591(-)
MRSRLRVARRAGVAARAEPGAVVQDHGLDRDRARVRRDTARHPLGQTRGYRRERRLRVRSAGLRRETRNREVGVCDFRRERVTVPGVARSFARRPELRVRRPGSHDEVPALDEVPRLVADGAVRCGARAVHGREQVLHVFAFDRRHSARVQGVQLLAVPQGHRAVHLFPRHGVSREGELAQLGERRELLELGNLAHAVPAEVQRAQRDERVEVRERPQPVFLHPQNAQIRETGEGAGVEDFHAVAVDYERLQRREAF